MLNEAKLIKASDQLLIYSEIVSIFILDIKNPPIRSSLKNIPYLIVFLLFETVRVVKSSILKYVSAPVGQVELESS